MSLLFSAIIASLTLISSALSEPNGSRIHPNLLLRSVNADQESFYESSDRSLFLTYRSKYQNGLRVNKGTLFSSTKKQRATTDVISDMDPLAINNKQQILGCSNINEDHDVIDQCHLGLMDKDGSLKVIDRKIPDNAELHVMHRSALNNQGQIIWFQRYREKLHSADENYSILFNNGSETKELLKSRSIAELGGKNFEAIDTNNVLISINDAGDSAFSAKVDLWEINQSGYPFFFISSHWVHIVQTADGKTYSPPLGSRSRIVDFIKSGSSFYILVLHNNHLLVKSYSGDTVKLSRPLRDDPRLVQLIGVKPVRGSTDTHISPHGFSNLASLRSDHPLSLLSASPQTINCGIENREHVILDDVLDILPHHKLLTSLSSNDAHPENGGIATITIPSTKIADLCTNIKAAVDDNCKDYFFGSNLDLTRNSPDNFECGFTVSSRDSDNNLLKNVTLLKDSKAFHLLKSRFESSSHFELYPECGGTGVDIQMPYNDPIYHSSEIVIGGEHCP